MHLFSLKYFKEEIGLHPVCKRKLHTLLMHPVKTRPRLWLRLLQFVYIKKGKGAVIYRSVRKDIVPFHEFTIGEKSVVEDFATINNVVGDINIGNYSRVGLYNTIIGPVQIGNQVNLAQQIVISGLNHNYRDVNRTIAEQGVSTEQIILGNDVWVGAGAIILAGVTIGHHAVVAAGSVVKGIVPPYCVVAGNPAKVVRQYDAERNEWSKVELTLK